MPGAKGQLFGFKNLMKKEQKERFIFLQAGGGVVYRRKGSDTQILLIHRRGLWDLPKGKIEPGELPEEGAMREVHEETGCNELEICFSLGVTEHVYRQEDVACKKTTHWYAMTSGLPLLAPQQDEEIDDLRWVELNAATTMVAFQNLAEVLKRFSETYSSVE